MKARSSDLARLLVQGSPSEPWDRLFVHPSPLAGRMAMQHYARYSISLVPKRKVSLPPELHGPYLTRPRYLLALDDLSLPYSCASTLPPPLVSERTILLSMTHDRVFLVWDARVLLFVSVVRWTRVRWAGGSSEGVVEKGGGSHKCVIRYLSYATTYVCIWV